MQNRRSYAGWVFLLTATLLVQEGLSTGLSAQAQSFQPVQAVPSTGGGFWGTTTNVITAPFRFVGAPVGRFFTGLTSGLAGPQKLSDLNLCPGNQVVQWPDKHKLIVDRDMHVVASTGGPQYTAMQPVSELPPTSDPVRSDKAFVIKGDGTIKEVNPNAKKNICPGGVYKRVGYKYVPARASVLSPGNILIDELGKRVQMTQKGLIAGNTLTPISEVADYAPGTKLVDELAMNPTVAQRAYGQNGRVSVSNKVIIPPTADIAIAPAGTRIAACTTDTTPYVGVGMIPTLTTADAAIINQYIDAQSLRANLAPSQFGALTPEQQQLVLNGQPMPVAVSGIQPVYILPSNMQSSLALNNTLTSKQIRDYGVMLPGDLQNRLSTLPTGYTRVIFGNHLVLLDNNNRIVAIQRNAIL